MDFIQILEAENSPRPKPKAPAYIVAAVVGGLTVFTTAVSIPFILPSLRKVCLPYLPATTRQIENVLEALKGRSGKVIDLGSGDGRVVIATAKTGLPSTGVEKNIWLVMYSSLVSAFKGVSHLTTFRNTNLWTFNLKPYNNIIIFGGENMMEKLENKFLKELEVGTQVVACRFPLPNTQPVKTLGNGFDKVWIYAWGKR